MALCAIAGLRRDIYVSETCMFKATEAQEASIECTKYTADESLIASPDDQSNIEEEYKEDYFQADVLWFTAFISIFFALCYDLYLSKKLANDLDQCDFYHQKDQITYETIT